MRDSGNERDDVVQHRIAANSSFFMFKLLQGFLKELGCKQGRVLVFLINQNSGRLPQRAAIGEHLEKSTRISLTAGEQARYFFTLIIGQIKVCQILVRGQKDFAPRSRSNGIGR